MYNKYMLYYLIRDQSFKSIIIMSFFFDQGTPSQSSQNQNTAFFQNGQTPKASIFDHAQSQSQIAYDLFNIQSNEVQEKERSIISKLDILDRIKEEESFVHHSTPFVAPQSNYKVQSQQSKMTFGNKLSNNLHQSKVEEKKEKKPRYFDDGHQKEKESKNRLKLFEPLSNFSFYNRSQHSNTRLEEPQSMPIKLEEQKKPSKKKFFDNASSKSSSISIDFDQLRQRQLQQSTPTTTASKLQSFKLLNQDKKASKIEMKIQTAKVQKLDNNGHKQMIQQPKKVERQSFAPAKQKKFQFNLRKSRVTEQNKPTVPPQKTFLGKINLVNNASSHGSATISNQSPIVQSKPETVLKSDVKRISQGSTLFKSRVKETNANEKTSMPSHAKPKQTDKGLQIFKSLSDQFKLSKLQKSSKSKVVEEQRKNPVLGDKYESLVQAFQKDSSISVDSRSQTSSKGKRQSIGLKQQLKKLSSRPTQKVQLKSIAFNKSFKFKQTKASPQEKPNQAKVQTRQLTKQIQDSTVQVQQNAKPTVEKNYLLPVKTTRNTQFSHFMLTLIELQQECQCLRQRTIQSRNSYRQLAILNDDINRRIDQCLNKRK